MKERTPATETTAVGKAQLPREDLLVDWFDARDASLTEERDSRLVNCYDVYNVHCRYEKYCRPVPRT
jgi:hypothetical protein